MASSFPPSLSSDGNSFPGEFPLSSTPLPSTVPPSVTENRGTDSDPSTTVPSLIPSSSSSSSSSSSDPHPSSVDHLLALLASPTVFLEDIGRCEHWYIESNLLEISLYGGILGVMAIGGLLGIFSFGIIFLPLLLFRFIGLVLDIGYISCNVGWANRVLRRSSFYLIPKIIRMIDEIGGTLSCLLLLFLATGSNGVLYLPRPGVVYSTEWISKNGDKATFHHRTTNLNPFLDNTSIYQTIFIPLWLSTGIQIGSILTLIGCCLFRRSVVWLGNIYDITYDPLAIRRPIPLVRLLCTSLFSRIIIISMNAFTIPLALKLDNYDSLPWSTVFYIPWLWISVATFMLIILFIALLCESLSKYNIPVRSKLYFGCGCLGIVMNVIVFGTTTLEHMQKEFTAADARRTMNPSQGFYLPYFSIYRIMVPWLTFLIISIVIMWFIYSALLSKWRQDLAILYGVSTPSTHQAVQFAYLENIRNQQRQQQRLGNGNHSSSSFFAFRTPGPLLPPPKELIKLTNDLYRRTVPTDNLEELRLITYPLFCTPPPKKVIDTHNPTDQPLSESKYGEETVERSATDGLASTVPSSTTTLPTKSRRSNTTFLNYFYSAPSTVTSPIAVPSMSMTNNTAVPNTVTRLSLSPRRLRTLHSTGTPRNDVPSFTPTVLSPIMSRTSTLSIHQNVHATVNPATITGENSIFQSNHGTTGTDAVFPSSIVSRLRTLSSPSRTTARHRLHVSLPSLPVTTTSSSPATTTSPPRTSDGSIVSLPPTLYIPRRAKRSLRIMNKSGTPDLPNTSTSTVLPLTATTNPMTIIPPYSRELRGFPYRTKYANKPKKFRTVSSTGKPNGSSTDLSSTVDDTNICMICCSEPADGVLLECGHGGLCFGCGNKLRQSSSISSRRCPYCRSFIESILRIPVPTEQTSCVIPVYQCNTYTMDSIVPTVTVMTVENITNNTVNNDAENSVASTVVSSSLSSSVTVSANDTITTDSTDGISPL